MEEKIKNINELGYKVLEYINSNNILIQDRDGYKYKIAYSDLKRGRTPTKIFKRSIFFEENLTLHFNLKFPKCHLHDINVNDKKEIGFTCDFHKEKGVMRTSVKNLQSKQRDNGTICCFCGREKISEKQKIKLTQIVAKCIKLNLSCIKTYYKDEKLYINYICNNHKELGMQTRTWASLKKSKNCCHFASPTRKYSHKEAIAKLEALGRLDTYKVVGEYINSSIPIKCECRKCGLKWAQLYSNMLRGNGCPGCRLSKGEKEISHFLKENNIDFTPQKSFENLVYKKPLRFDFFLDNLNIVIEYQGEQHYAPVSFSSSKSYDAEKVFKENVLRDRMKEEYCQENNIKLICIPYTEFKNINKILRKELDITN